MTSHSSSSRYSRPFSSAVLDGYKKTLLEWAERHQYTVRDGMLLKADAADGGLPGPARPSFCYGDFMRRWIGALREIPEDSLPVGNADAYALLPYIAFLRKSRNLRKDTFFELFKLAYSHASQYNRMI